MTDVHQRKTVCLDFDGVLHPYSKGWHDGTIYDEPTNEMVGALWTLKANFNLVISTCREDRAAIKAYMLEYYKMDVEVTNAKPIASVYIDDRAVRHEGDWADTLGQVFEIMGGVPAIEGPGAGRGGGG